MLSPNTSGKRKYNLERITPHCVVGQLSAEAIGNCFRYKSRKASCNYGIATDGKVVEVVAEDERSWCSSSADNDNRAITIECASDKTSPYAMNQIVYDKLVELCVDICKRNNKSKVLFLGDKDKSLAYKVKDNEVILTAHRWFAKKSCPGDWLYSRYGQLANDITERLNNEPKTEKANNTTLSDNKSLESAQMRAEGYSKGATFTTIAKSGLNIRLGAGSNKPLEGKSLPYGTKVKWYGYYSVVNNDKWYLVSFGTRKGYCMSKFLR